MTAGPTVARKEQSVEKRRVTDDDEDSGDTDSMKPEV
jgi:hypothetical protein